MGWIRTNDGYPTDLQSAALTTQPPPLEYILANLGIHTFTPPLISLFLVQFVLRGFRPLAY